MMMYLCNNSIECSMIKVKSENFRSCDLGLESGFYILYVHYRLNMLISYFWNIVLFDLLFVLVYAEYKKNFLNSASILSPNLRENYLFLIKTHIKLFSIFLFLFIKDIYKLYTSQLILTVSKLVKFAHQHYFYSFLS